MIVKRKNTLSRLLPETGSDAVSETVCLSSTEIGSCATLRSRDILSEFDVSVVSIGVSDCEEDALVVSIGISDCEEEDCGLAELGPLLLAVGNGNCTVACLVRRRTSGYIDAKPFSNSRASRWNQASNL